MTLKTERLTLRPPIDQDVDAYYDICNSEFVLQYNAMTKKSKEDILSAFKRSREADDMLLLELIDCKRVIGAVFIESDSIRWDVNSKELSYFLGEQYSRKGYMKEALSEVIRSLCENQSVACLTARAFVPNIASRRLLESLGFHLDGVIPHCVMGYGGIIFDDTLYSYFPSNS